MPHPTTENDLLALIGQPESARLEFKSGRLFEDRQRAVDKLSTEVSAFANSEGGVLVLGVTERRDERGPSVASGLDGVEATVTPEWLQQVIESNISPHLPGLRVKRIQLSDAAGRVAFVVDIPRGTTAYQAVDRRYYGRSEFEVKPLPDHEVRLRMQRGRLAQVRFSLDDELQDARQRLSNWADCGDEPPDFLRTRIDSLGVVTELKVTSAQEYFEFSMKVMNTGETTVTGLTLQMRVERPDGWNVACGDKWVGPQLRESMRFDLPEIQKIFPGDTIQFPAEVFSVIAPIAASLATGGVKIVWTAFLDNAPQSSGEVDLIPLLERTLKRRRARDSQQE